MFAPGQTMYARQADSIVRHNCEFCGMPLNPHQAVSSGICTKPLCHAKKIEQVGTALLARKRKENAERRAAMFEKMAPEIARGAEALGVEPDAVVKGLVPAQEPVNAPLPAERRALIEAHLRLITARAFTEEPGEIAMDVRIANEQDMHGVFETGCTACKGSCCAIGGNTGNLMDSDIHLYRQRHPEATEDDIVSVYLDHVPEVTTVDGCVYQGETGCALPRTLRSEQCNSFYCRGMKYLLTDYMESENGKAVIIGADRTEPLSVLAFDPETGTVEIASFAKAATTDSNPHSFSISSEDCIPDPAP